MRWIVLLGLLAAGCDDGGGDPLDGALPDLAPRTDRGPMPDAAVDSAVDAAGDAARDAMPDAMPDAIVDAMPDAIVDAMPDAIVDAMPDAIVDAMPDAMPDMAPPPACGHPRSTCRADADCPGGRCGPIPQDPDAPCVCIGPRPDPVRAFCGGGGPFESECCEDADCPAPLGGVALCQQSVYGPQNEYCGGAAPPDENACRVDGCAADADCGAGEVCIPAGAFGFVTSTCRPAPCRVDADCAARPGGECRPYFSRCISASFGCSYPDSPCRTDDDCPVGRFGDQEHCVPGRDGDTTCQEYLPPP